MILLTTTTDVVRLVTSAAVALDVHASYVDNTTVSYTPGRQNTAISTATTATVLDSPAASTQRQLKHLKACARGGANTVTVQFYDGATAFQALSASLATGETIEYEDGRGWAILDATGAIKTTGVGSGRLLRAPQVLTSGTTINHPTGTATIVVEVIGAGGGGGGAVNSAASNVTLGAGGGSGAYAEKSFAAAASSSTYAIGGAGTAGANTGAAAGNGGSTTFTHNGVTVTSPGGNGAPANTGSGMAGVTGTAFAASGPGTGAAVATNGDLNEGGTDGGWGVRFSGTTGQSGGGAGIYGGGGPGRTTQGNGNAATGPGAGGAGGLSTNAGGAVTGGAGGAGLIIVREYS